jgi:copper(I)-binding protein/cytochrome oxidase Cu insertion factor (SCO1/SenC/PrrC family)
MTGEMKIRASLLSKSLAACGIVLSLILGAFSTEASNWGGEYFPNIPLVTEEGEEVRFFDDLIEGKVVAINFIYTTCPDTCPLETAQLLKVEEILGDRMGQDVFFYSITIDPETDTPAVMKEYKERFGASWTFLSGDKEDIVLLRRKLGLYIDEIQDGSKNHNVSMIIGNQETGRWMRRSPMENPYVLADQLGNWLTGWKAAQPGESYASAPKLRNISTGEQLFRTRCATCHSVNGSDGSNALGPDLLGVNDRRDKGWLLRWLQAPDRMLEAGDPIATQLYEEYGQVAMPNMRLNREEAEALLDYLGTETARREKAAIRKQFLSRRRNRPAGDVVAVMNAWVREADDAARMNAGYMTLVNAGSKAVRLVKVESKAFDYVEVHEMAQIDGLMEMREIDRLVIPAKAQAELAPGGKHLMMSGPREPLEAGQRVDLVLTFDSGVKQTVSVRVAAM